MAFFLPPHLEKRFTQRAKNAIYASGNPEDLLNAFLKERGSLAQNILEAHKISPRKTRDKTPRPLRPASLDKARDKQGKKAPAYAKASAGKRGKQTRDKAPDKDLRAIIKRATSISVKYGQPYVGTEHLLYALLLYTDMFKKKESEKMKKHLTTILSQNVNLSHFPDNIFKKGLKTKKNIKVNKSARSAHPALDAFCENLTALAESKMLEPVIGRDKEISRIIYTLSRRAKNNPLLIGEPGVGKTAIVQGLAQKISNGEVPISLLRKNIFSLNLNSLIAGTMFRGDFEMRLKDIIEEASRSDTILFIDEIHTVIGAGAAQGSQDAANTLKPALSEGGLQCIGATTFEEYRKYIEKERALERRFHPIMIEEETEENSMVTLSNFKKFYEKHHGIIIDDEAIEAAVTLSARYIPDRFLPDKAFDVLDEAASKLKSISSTTDHTRRLRELEKQKFTFEKNKEKAIAEENYQDAVVLKYKQGLLEEEMRRFGKKFFSPGEKPRLTRSDIEQVIKDITGIPIKSKDGHTNLKKLATYLNKEIVGQKEAISILLETLKRKDVGLTDAQRPTGSFLFVGPCGVGKTALAKALAELNSQKLIKLDMSEYAEPYTISRLIGSPPGYVGYGESGELTEKIRRSPHAIVLFDEIEKAHGQVHNILLSILEEGTIQDGSGRSVSFKNAIIILTSNTLMPEAENSNTLGFSQQNPDQNQTASQAKYLDAIKEALRPEILNRIDKVIAFNLLGKKEIFNITKLHLYKMKERIKPLDLNFSNEVISHTAQRAYKPNNGARLVRSTIEQIIESPLAEFLIKNPDAKSARVEVKKGKINVT